jgi:hypothetical protein
MKPNHPSNAACVDRRMSQVITSALALATLVATVGIAGCGSSSQNAIVNPSGTLAGMPTPSTPTTANTYVGTDSLNVWSLNLDDTASSYSYTNSTTSSAPVTGTFTTSNGFLNLGESGGISLGYALEVQSRMALLRPGDATAGLVLSVPQTTCYSIPYRLLFNYIAMEAAPSGNTFTTGNYASVVLNTDSTGAAWQFQDLQGDLVNGPNSFTETCAVAGGEATVSVQGDSVFNTENNSDSLPSTYFKSGTGGSYSVSTNVVAIGPSGVFLTQQSLPGKGASAAGVAEPTSALSTTSIAAKSYLGFLTQAAGDLSGTTYRNPGFTSPVSFGPVTTSSSTMTGGVFPSDDVTQTPNSDTIITLGKQSGTYNGLYPNATVTMLDSNQNCTTEIAGGITGLTVGVNADGYITCTYPAVAVVGNPEGKYVIFLDAFNWTANSVSTKIGAPMQIYLFQQ